MGEIQVIFLGTGDAFNDGGRANQAIWIQSSSMNILVDCGPTTLQQMVLQNLNSHDLDCILITHFHGDHFIGAIFLDLAMSLRYERSKPLIYGGPRGIEGYFEDAYKVCYGDLYPNYAFPRKFQEYLPNQEYCLGKNVKIFPISMNHRKESLGYRIQIEDKTVAITGDTAWTPDLIRLCEDADLFITECEFYKKHPTCKIHLSYSELEQQKSLLKARKIIITHCSKEVTANAEKIAFPLAKDNMKITI